jgi:hypothetical protein
MASKLLVNPRALRIIRDSIRLKDTASRLLLDLTDNVRILVFASGFFLAEIIFFQRARWIRSTSSSRPRISWPAASGIWT